MNKLFPTCVAMVLACGLLLGRASPQAEREFEAAQRQEAAGDLRGAIRAYEKIADGSDRSLAVIALLHLSNIYKTLADQEDRKNRDRNLGVSSPTTAAADARPQGVFEIPVPVLPDPFNWALSPDGRTVAYVAAVSSAAVGPVARGSRGPLCGLWIRSLDRADDRMLPGTEDAKQESAPPFWSPDGRFIAFPAHDGNVLQLKKVAVAGGLPEVIATMGPRGTTLRRGVWGRDGFILFANDVLRRVSASGGPVTTLTTLDRSLGETSHSSPWLLPDGQHFIYKAWSDQPQNRMLYIGSLNSTARTPLIDANSRAIFADGFILFTRQGTLLAQQFDIERLQFTGTGAVVAEGLTYDRNLGITGFDVSMEGTLIYRMDHGGGNRGGPTASTGTASPNLTVVRNWTSRVKR